MSTLDLYTPWREELEVLSARTVGREELLTLLESAVREHLAGQRALPPYVFGPRGVGKSHVLTLAARRQAAACRAQGYVVLHAPEDLPACSNHTDLLTQILKLNAPRPAWMRSAPPPGLDTAPQRAVLYIEALDRRLGELSPIERKALRAWLARRPGWLLVGTGVGLTVPFTQKDEAFYGHFHANPIEALTAEEAAALLDRQVPEALREEPAWPGRRDALVALAGGSPRTLMSLAESCAARPEDLASEHLHAVIRQFTAHYQMRFRDLSPDGQRILAALAEAPRELTTTELQRALGKDQPASVSKTARRMVDDGVLGVREEGRHSFYRVLEPLLRHGYEYRTAPWDQTRAGWMGRLLEAVLSPVELSQAWLGATDPQVQEAVDRVAQANPEQAVRLLATAFGGGATETGAQAQSKLQSWPPERLAALARALSAPLRAQLQPIYKKVRGVQAIALCWEAEPRLAQQPRDTFAALLSSLSSQAAELHPSVWPVVDNAILRGLRAATPQGRPWELDLEETARLAGLPYLRVRYLSRGKRHSHPPLLSLDELAWNLKRPEIDFEHLLAAALSHQHLHLLTTLLAAAQRMPEAPRVGSLRQPHLPPPAGTEEALLTLLGRSLEAGRTTVPEALGWAGVLARVPPEAAGRLTEQLRARLPSPAPEDRWTLLLALSRLGQLSRDRFDQLTAALKADEHLRALCEEAEALLRQLDESKGGHLHPELATLARVLRYGAAR